MGQLEMVTREQVLAYRVAAHGLDRDTTPLAVLDLGVQDTPYGSARLALAARGATSPDDLVLVWALRGAPHLHRRRDLARLAPALWPLSDADATARIASTQIREGSKLGLAAFAAAAEAMREVVTEPMAKGEVSGQVSARIPKSLTYDCRTCKARHISGALFQQVGLAAGVSVEVRGSSTWLLPLNDPPDLPAASAGAGRVLADYLRLHGPATLAEAAKFVGATQSHARPAWPSGLVEVAVDDRRAWIPEDRLESLRSAPPPRLVRLLPPSDPYLQARDRDLLVPDRIRQAVLWRMLGNPGALLVDGEITGTWRAKAAKTRLDLTVTPFERLTAATRSAIEREAAVIAQVRGVSDANVLWDE